MVLALAGDSTMTRDCVINKVLMVKTKRRVGAKIVREPRGSDKRAAIPAALLLLLQ